MKYQSRGIFGGSAVWSSEEINLPSEEEMAKSLISPKENPYLVRFTFDTAQGKKNFDVKITKMGRETAFPSNALQLYGFVKNREEMHYTHNSNWFELREQVD
ncbi:MAG: hypothetical protein KBB88_03515 [Candidatus Pacebacteria bacterium]|nr:hypothetical protein [Candidatus Paceibacterota bacterium]